jgi:hypothetical protein
MRRGFAMPIVLVVALLVGIVAAVMLERQGAQRLSVRRQLNQYRDHHFERGVREVVGAWTDLLSGQPIDKLVEADGHALDVAMTDGSWLSVYVFDGQGTMLTEPTGLNEEERQDAAGLAEQLLILSAGNPDPRWLRPAGPVKISAVSAATEVLTAVGNYASGGGRAGRRLAESIIDARQRGELTDADLQTAASAAGLDAEARQVLSRVLVPKPDLWLMVIDVYPAPAERRSEGPLARYSGLFMPPGVSGGRQSVSLQSLGKFLTWEELPLEQAGVQ